MIVPDSHPEITYEVLDNDVAVIDVATLAVDRYLAGAGTTLFDLALNPAGTEIWVANTEALNHVRFEPELRGHFIDNRVTKIELGSGAAMPVGLNPGIDYTTLPNPAAQASAIAQPTGIVFEPDGAHLWVAGFGSDIVARVDAATGVVVGRVDVGYTVGTDGDEPPSGEAWPARAGPRYGRREVVRSQPAFEHR